MLIYSSRHWRAGWLRCTLHTTTQSFRVDVPGTYVLQGDSIYLKPIERHHGRSKRTSALVPDKLDMSDHPNSQLPVSHRLNPSVWSVYLEEVSIKSASTTLRSDWDSYLALLCQEGAVRVPMTLCKSLQCNDVIWTPISQWNLHMSLSSSCVAAELNLIWDFSADRHSESQSIMRLHTTLERLQCWQNDEGQHHKRSCYYFAEW